MQKKNVTIYHNPRCSKSRETLRILKERGVEPTVVEYLATPPAASEIRKILGLLKMKPRDIIRKNEDPYKHLGLENPKVKDAMLIQAMAKHPILIQRPIVVSGAKAVVARPPETVLKIL